MKDRIGTMRPLSWPRFDVNGVPYNRPATTVGLDDNHFVVSLKGEISDEQRAAFMKVISGEADEAPKKATRKSGTTLGDSANSTIDNEG